MRVRIRSIKPEFFTDHDLWLAESESGLPCRLAFAGLWCCADREGRFPWKPAELKIYVLPYDKIADFGRVLDALVTRGFLVRYASPDGSEWGWIPTFHRHQAINGREEESSRPAPDSSVAPTKGSTRASRVAGESDTRADASLSEPNRTEPNRTEPVRKGRVTKDDPPGFADSFAAYPKRAGGNSRSNALLAWRARLAEHGPAEGEVMAAGTLRYAAYCRATDKEGSQWVKMAETFFGIGHHYAEPWEAAGDEMTLTLTAEGDPSPATADALRRALGGR